MIVFLHVLAALAGITRRGSVTFYASLMSDITGEQSTPVLGVFGQILTA